ncbi:MAG: ParB N-terminal domain-containing protein [Rhizobiales bacterium]|nr:ParB N-terminal domain-containing protein [Hyphomicrobiales bacterium]
MERLSLHLDQLVINPDINPRHASDAEVGDLVAQIRANGFTDPLWVRPLSQACADAQGLGNIGITDLYEVIDGSRRLRAVREVADALGITTIPVDVMEADDARARELALAANVARAPLTPADEARAFHALKMGGMTALHEGIDAYCQSLTGQPACHQHFFGEVGTQDRADVAWPPRTALFFNQVSNSGIWFTYKSGRFFPLRYWYAIDPRGADAEGDHQQFIFDVRKLPKQFRTRLTAIGTVPLHCHAKESAHIRRAIQRALLADFDFASHIAAENQAAREEATRERARRASLPDDPEAPF